EEVDRRHREIAKRVRELVGQERLVAQASSPTKAGLDAWLDVRPSVADVLRDGVSTRRLAGLVSLDAPDLSDVSTTIDETSPFAPLAGVPMAGLRLPQASIDFEPTAIDPLELAHELRAGARILDLLLDATTAEGAPSVRTVILDGRADRKDALKA